MMRLDTTRRYVGRIIRRGHKFCTSGYATSLMLIFALMLPYTVPTLGFTPRVSKASSNPSSELTSPTTAEGLFPGAPLTVPPTQENKGMPPPDQPSQPLVGPSAPLACAVLESAVSSLALNPQGPITLQRQQPLTMGALPLNSSGNAVQGLAVTWQSSNSHVVSVTPAGQAIGGNSGTATLTAQAGGQSATVQVTVVASTWNGGGTKPDSVRASIPQSYQTAMIARESSGDGTRNKKLAEMSHVAKPVVAPMPLRPPNEDPLPDSETNSLYAPTNIVGTPPGRTEPGAGSAQAATGGTEMPGSSNFTFGVPIIGLPGRGGLNASLSLFYNSRLWHKSTSLDDKEEEITHLTFDVDSAWPAPGFRLGYGQLEAQGSYGFTLTDANGTRHQLLKPVNANYYEATDGTFIRLYNGGQSGGTVRLADGTRVEYGAAGSGGFRSFPKQIIDPHGNVIQVFYVSDVGPKIDYIEDTLARRIQFVYNNGELVSIKAPGYDNSQTPREVIRFYYESWWIDPSFDSSICSTCYSQPGTVRVVKHVFIPGLIPEGLPAGTQSGSGYSYDYSTYGMISVITQYRRMQINESTGELLNPSQWQQAASTRYNYPAGHNFLTDVPKFTQRLDTWSGITTAAPLYTFAVDEQQYGVSTSSVTAPDGTVTETKIISSNGAWDDGLVKETIFKKGTKVWAKTALNWEQTPGTNIPRLKDVKVTNEAGQTRATVYDSYGTFNNVLTISERDFADSNTYGTELRRIQKTYETSTNYTDRRILHLPRSVQIVANGKVASRTEYAYDGYQLVDVVPNNFRIPTQNQTYNPYTLDQTSVCTQYDSEGQCINWQLVSVYDPGTSFRGDLTSVKTYADADASTGMTENTMKYDITGNVVEATVNCCRRKTFTYSSAYWYAYQTGISRGDAGQFTSGATYDFNTGLARTATDENNYQTTLYYDARTLRQLSVQTANGGKTDFYYNDGLFPDPDAAHGHSYVHTATKLDDSVSGGRWVLNYTFYDGHGAAARNFSNWRAYNLQNPAEKAWETADIEYDIMGRVKGTNNPYYSAGAEGGQINQQGWTYRQYDDLGRMISVTSPDNTSIGIDYNGTVTTVTDQAQRKRRQITDALGRMVRVDESNASGSLGPDVEHPAQPTKYIYDALDNLIYGEQSDLSGNTQRRYFKYDSLSRLIYDRQVEQSATPYTTTDSVENNSAWSNKMIYDTRGLLTDAYDARQIHTHFEYDDGLNRLTKITYTKADGSPEGTPMVSYTYDQQHSGYSNAGRLTAIKTEATANAPQTIQAYDYNQVGQVARQQQTVGANNPYILYYTYNLIGALTSEQYPSGRVISHTYDEGTRLVSISGTATGQPSRTYLNNLSYAAHGGMLSATMGNGAVETMSYNSRLQPESISLTKNSVLHQKYDYQYGVVNATTGDVDTSKNTGQVGRIEGFIGTDRQWQQRFSYDSLGRLSQAAEFRSDNNALSLTYRANYDYDRFGNRYQKAAQNPANETLPFVPVEDQNIDKLTNRYSAGFGVTYDLTGNVTEDNKFRGQKYEYDASGRQWWSAPLNNLTNAAIAAYDGIGQRVLSTANGITTIMVYDIFGQLVAEYGGEPTSGAGGVQYVMADLQGSTRAVLNNDGAVVARHDYEVFGAEIGAGVGKRTGAQRYSISDSTRQRYAGMEQEGELNHTWFRKYENKSGRWTTPDPLGGRLGDPQSFNRYSYVRNDPVNFVDSSGLELTSIWDTLNGSGAWVGWGSAGNGFFGQGNLIDRPHDEERRRIMGILNSDVRETRRINSLRDYWIYIDSNGKAGGIAAWSSSAPLDDPLLIFHMVQDAYLLAVQILENNPACASYITSEGNPAEVLKAIRNNKGVTVVRGRPIGEYGRETLATTYGRGEQEAAQIDLYLGFFDADVLNTTNVYNISPVEARAAVFLHELKHAFGDKHNSAKESDEWNENITNLCFTKGH